MNYDEFKNYIKSENIDNNIFMLYGEEVFLKNHGLKELLKRVEPKEMPEFNVFNYDGKKYDLISVKEAIDALPVFADSKLLLFNNSGLFLLTGKDAATKEYREFWEEIIDEIPENVYIIFNEDKIDKRSALYKKLLKKNSVVEFSYLSESKMINWTVSLFKTMGKVISPHEAKYLIEITQDGMTAVKREAEKISAYTDGKVQISRQDINDVTVPVIENKVFDMVDAIFSKNAPASLGMLNDLLVLKEDESKILAAISSNVEKFLMVKLLSEDRMDSVQIASKAKIPPFIVSKYIKSAKKYETKDLEQFLSKCVETDRIYKQKRSDRAVILQTLVAEFSTK